MGIGYWNVVLESLAKPCGNPTKRLTGGSATSQVIIYSLNNDFNSHFYHYPWPKVSSVVNTVPLEMVADVTQPLDSSDSEQATPPAPEPGLPPVPLALDAPAPEPGLSPVPLALDSAAPVDSPVTPPEAFLESVPPSGLTAPVDSPVTPLVDSTEPALKKVKNDVAPVDSPVTPPVDSTEPALKKAVAPSYK